jgi:hypothetical protein
MAFEDPLPALLLNITPEDNRRLTVFQPERRGGHVVRNSRDGAVESSLQLAEERLPVDLYLIGRGCQPPNSEVGSLVLGPGVEEFHRIDGFEPATGLFHEVEEGRQLRGFFLEDWQFRQLSLSFEVSLKKIKVLRIKG